MIRMRVDQALGREAAYSTALRLLEDADTWADVAAVQRELRELLAQAKGTIEHLT